MRDVEFRGKRKDIDNWVHGYLFKIWESTYILWGTTNDIPDMIEVNPESISQYTGLSDCLGNKIFEGDILDCGDRIVKVVWNLNCGTWDCDFIRYTNKPLHSNGISPVDWKYRSTIIGNIYDNSELA